MMREIYWQNLKIQETLIKKSNELADNFCSADKSELRESRERERWNDFLVEDKMVSITKDNFPKWALS